MKTYSINTCLLIIRYLVLLAVLFSPFNTMAQQASAFQAGHYYPGLINTRDMAQPPSSGLFILWYNFYASSSAYYDQNGDKFDGISLSDLNPVLPDINASTKLNGFGSAPVFAWASSKIKSLGDARYIVGIAPNYVSADVSLFTEGTGNVLEEPLSNETGAKVSGFGDLIFIPFGLSWGGRKMDFTTAYTIYAPTGRYTTGASDNIGLGYWTHQLQGFGYYYPIEDKSSAIMLGLTYEANSKIKDSDVRPGSRFTLEYGLSQFFSEYLEVGIAGAHNWQVSEDTGDDVFWNTANLDRKSSLFFNVGYWPIPQRLNFNFKYGFDYGLRQRFKNNMFVLNLLFNPNLLVSKKE